MARPPYYAKLSETEVPFVIECLALGKTALFDTLTVAHKRNPESPYCDTLRAWIAAADALSDRLLCGAQKELDAAVGKES